MRIDEARQLAAALEAAATDAEAAGHEDIDLGAVQNTLSLALGQALDGLDAAIADARARGARKPITD